ncbi:MAG: hypothetical protein PHU36_04500 [Syntrophomonadaceae bacterium]|nr:hypothetical protein [Syntrophomonadaceae bacterium]
MKDLFVLTADLDAKVVIQAILQRHNSLSIHPVSFDVDRHTMRDAGVVKDGPELARIASLTDWRKSRSFESIVSLLRKWFPQ